MFVSHEKGFDLAFLELQKDIHYLLAIIVVLLGRVLLDAFANTSNQSSR